MDVQDGLSLEQDAPHGQRGKTGRPKSVISGDEFRLRGRVRDATLPLAHPRDGEARPGTTNAEVKAGGRTLGVRTTGEISIREKMGLPIGNLVTTPPQHT